MYPFSLQDGTLNYTITDQNGCTYSNSVVITEPSTISVNPTTTNVSCNGLIDGTAILNEDGGTGNLSINMYLIHI